PEWAVPRNFTATIGLPIREDGRNESENITLAARNALRNMVESLQERGWSSEQAYVICSVAVDLRVSNVVDLPNVMVSALLPEGGATVPDEPPPFGKYANSVIGPDREIVVPPATERPDYEAELGVVIGKVAHSVGIDQALSYVAGYTCLNDVSSRDLQSSNAQ